MAWRSDLAKFGEETVLIGGLLAPAQVPLPATLALAAFGLMGWFQPRRRVLNPARAGVPSPGLRR